MFVKNFTSSCLNDHNTPSYGLAHSYMRHEIRKLSDIIHLKEAIKREFQHSSVPTIRTLRMEKVLQLYNAMELYVFHYSKIYYNMKLYNGI